MEQKDARSFYIGSGISQHGEENVSERIERLAAERHLPARHLQAWLALNPCDQAALLDVATKLKLRTGQLVVALELLSEIAVRESLSIADLLARDELKKAIEGPGSRPQRAHAFIEALRELRYPRLAHTYATLRQTLAKADLPSFVTVEIPKNLNTGELKIELKFSSVADLDTGLDALVRNRAVLAKMLRILDGSDEVQN